MFYAVYYDCFLSGFFCSKFSKRHSTPIISSSYGIEYNLFLFRCDKGGNCHIHHLIPQTVTYFESLFLRLSFE